MYEFLGTMALVVAIAVGAYWIGRSRMNATVRYWQQQAIRAEEIADQLGRAAMENYVDIAVTELRQGR